MPTFILGIKEFIGIPNRAWVKGYGQEGGDKKQLSKMTETSVDGSSLLASQMMSLPVGLS